jgi:hypothetical protein
MSTQTVDVDAAVQRALAAERERERAAKVITPGHSEAWHRLDRENGERVERERREAETREKRERKVGLPEVRATAAREQSEAIESRNEAVRHADAEHRKALAVIESRYQVAIESAQAPVASLEAKL